MTFSTNQVRHLYVVKGTQASVGTADTAGKLAVKADSAKSHLYFEYKSPGGLVRSDLIDIKNIIAAKATDATSLRRELGQVKVALDSAVNSGNPVAGQDYLLRVAIRQFAGMSDEDQYFKHGLVRATSGMTAEQFYTKLKDSLVMNFSREGSKLLDFTSDATGVTITEVEQEWKRGVLAQVPVYFSVHPTTILVGGVDEIWGVATPVPADPDEYVGNGKNIADLEYFCMGERGDQYRNIGWPHVFETTYLVDPAAEYCVLDIHYAYVGSNEGVQKSERDITLVGSKADINTVIGAINTAAGTAIATLA